MPLTVYFDDAGWPSVVANTYDAWTCANLAYGAVIKLDSQWEFADLDFSGKRFHTAMLEKEYSALPSVKDAKKNTYWDDGPDVCLEFQGDQDFYIFDVASGDCPAGCMYHQYYGFQAGPLSAPVALGTYEPGVTATEPQWYTDLADCRTRL